MLNTCSIGRRWKSREGWSRPVLTGERGTLFPIPSWGLGLVLWWFSRWMARNAVSCGHDDTGKAFRLRPLSGSRTATTGIGRVAGSVAGRSVWSAVQSGFAVVMAQVRRPVPFRTRKLRPGTAMVLHSRGCGRVARRRIQRWGFPSSFGSGNPFFCLLCRPAGRSPLPEVSPSGLSRCSASGLFHAPGDLRAPRDFRDFRGASCAYPMVE